MKLRQKKILFVKWWYWKRVEKTDRYITCLSTMINDYLYQRSGQLFPSFTNIYALFYLYTIGKNRHIILILIYDWLYITGNEICFYR